MQLLPILQIILILVLKCDVFGTLDEMSIFAEATQTQAEAFQCGLWAKACRVGLLSSGKPCDLDAPEPTDAQ